MRFFITTFLIIFSIWLLASCKGKNDNNSKELKDSIASSKVEDINPGNEQQNIEDLIRVKTPEPGAKISSPLTVSGEARGYWFFEASFSIDLVDGNGNKLAVAVATAQQEWMTEEFVPFKVEVKFEAPPTTTNGYLIFNKANASGDPERDRALKIPIIFSESP